MIIGFVAENDEFETRSMLLPEHVSALNKLVKRRGKLYVINKKNPRMKARQG